MKRVISSFLTISLVGLAGCASNTWAPGPNAKGSFEEAKGNCSLMAQGSERGFYARGTQDFVAGAALGNAIGNAIREQATFNNCMSANGWIAVDKKTGTTADTAANNQAAAIIADSKACIEATRNNPEYAPISAHLVSTASMRYSLTQMADTSYPTVSDGKLLASYGDEIAICREKTIAEIAKIDPRVVPRERELTARFTDLNLQLIARRLTWGEYSHAAQDLADAAASNQPLPPIAIPASNLSSVPANHPVRTSAVQPVASSTCTHEQQVEARIARENGYTGGPKCD